MRNVLVRWAHSLRLFRRGELPKLCVLLHTNEQTNPEDQTKKLLFNARKRNIASFKF